VTLAESATPLARDVLDRVTSRFEAARDPQAAPAMRAYMRDQFAFLGIPSPKRVALSRTAIAGLPRPTAGDLDAIAHSCWQRDEREYQYFAIWYLRRHIKELPAEFIDTARALIVTRSWWDTVDDLAQNVVGPVVRTHGLATTMDQWIDEPDLWLARTAILHQTRYKAATDADRLFRYCERRATDSEFFIRKAIGWALREHSRTDPAAVGGGGGPPQ